MGLGLFCGVELPVLPVVFVFVLVCLFLVVVLMTLAGGEDGCFESLAVESWTAVPLLFVDAPFSGVVDDGLTTFFTTCWDLVVFSILVFFLPRSSSVASVSAPFPGVLFADGFVDVVGKLGAGFCLEVAVVTVLEDLLALEEVVIVEDLVVLLEEGEGEDDFSFFVKDSSCVCLFVAVPVSFIFSPCSGLGLFVGSFVVVVAFGFCVDFPD